MTSKSAIESAGVRCEAVSMDFAAEPERSGELVDRCIEVFDRIDVLVNNAAVAPLRPFAEITDKEFEEAINVNHRAVFYLTRAAWSVFLKQREGAIFNVSSLAAVDPFPGFSIYGASKAWIDLITHALGSEGRDHNIRVYSIRPGAVETPLLRRLFPDFPVDQAVSPYAVAHKIWEVFQQKSLEESGQAWEVSNQQ